MKQILISHSEGDQFVRCEAAHWYGYGMKLQAKSNSGGMFRGTLNHMILEIFFKSLKNGWDYETARTRALKYMNLLVLRTDGNFDVILELQDFVPGFLLYYRQNYMDKGWTILAVEKEFRLTLPSPYEGYEYVYPFKIDLILQNKVGDIYIWDHKTIYNFYTDEEVALMPQLPRYIGALRALGFKVHGAMLNQIRWRPVKSTATKDHYRTESIYLSDTKIQNMFLEHLKNMRAIAEYKLMPEEQWRSSVRRTLSQMVCKNCPFKTLCLMDLSGKDLSLTMRTLYEPNTYGYKVDPNAD